MAVWILFFFFGIILGEDNSSKNLVHFSPQIFEEKNQPYLAVSFQNAPHWHTYWKNPGDAGLPFKFKFELNGREISLTSMEWPTPKHFPGGKDLLSFGYEGEYSFFFLLNEGLAKKIRRGNFTVFMNWLACKDICIPGKGQVSLNNGEFSVSSEKLKERFENLPKERNLGEFSMELDRDEGNNMSFYYHLATSLSGGKSMLIPFPNEFFEFKREKLVKAEKGIYGRYTLQWVGEYASPTLGLPEDGRFLKPLAVRFLVDNPITGKTEIIERKISSFNTGDGKLKNLYQAEKENSKKKELETKGKRSLFYYMILALLGGLILNGMPCVLPVILLKLFSLIKEKGEDRRTIFVHNMTYSLGVLFSFFILAFIVVIIKSTGKQIGWGFQLQSPEFIAGLIVILFIFTLNLFGLFEFKTPGGSFLGNLQIKKGIVSHFLSGVFSTILATPCTAPFLGTALAFAFTGSTLTIFVIFLFIGIGLALPFIATGIYPRLIAFFPKPGAWMEHLKKFLGMTMIFAIIWLLDIFYSQTRISHTWELVIVLSLLFFAFYGFQNIFKTLLWRSVFFCLPLVLFVYLYTSLNHQGDNRELSWQIWSEQSLEGYEKREQTVFMNFTAKWCVTCKVNERLIFSREDFFELLKKYDVVPVKADWTKRDEVIGNWLERQKVAGVPAYFIQTGKGKIINLGEITSLREIKSYLENNKN